MAEKKAKIVSATEEEVARYAPGSPVASAAQQAGDADGSGGDANGPADLPQDRNSAPQSEGGKAQDTPAEPKASAEKADTVESLRAQLEEHKDKLLRAQAECANISRRLRQQHAESLKLARMDLARALLPVVDNFDRTLGSLGESSPDDPIVQGVTLIAAQLLKTLEEHGVRPIEAVGKPFDPTLHEAMMQDRRSERPTGTVTEELQRGYKMNDRVLRPAKVGVAAGPEQVDESEGASSTRRQAPEVEDPASGGEAQRRESGDADV